MDETAEGIKRVLEDMAFAEMFEEAEREEARRRTPGGFACREVLHAVQRMVVGALGRDDSEVDLITSSEDIHGLHFSIPYTLLKQLCDRAKAYNDIREALSRVGA